MVDEVDSVLLLFWKAWGPSGIFGSVDFWVDGAVGVGEAGFGDGVAGGPVDDVVELLYVFGGVVEVGHGVEVASDDDGDVFVFGIGEAGFDVGEDVD